MATVLIGSGVPSDAGLATTGVGAGPMLAGGVQVSSSLFAWSEYRMAQRRYEADLEEYARRTAAGAQDAAGRASCNNDPQCGQVLEPPRRPSAIGAVMRAAATIRIGLACSAKGVLVSAISTPIGGFATGAACSAILTA